MTEEIKKTLKAKWLKLSAQKKWLDTFPDKNPVLISSKKEKGKTGVYFLRPYILDYRHMAEYLLADRNKTIKENFVWYCRQFISQLIEQKLTEDQVLDDLDKGKETYSLNLKKISRNYSQFNDLLIGENILEVTSLHDTKEGKCIEYQIDSKILKKGICREYLSKIELARLVEMAGGKNKADKTTSSPPEVVKGFISTLKKTKIKMSDVLKLEIEAGRFVKLYPSAVRFIAGKYDANIGEKDGRFHANYTYAPSEFRSLMRYGGRQRFVEGDVAACHFHFLLDEMTDAEERSAMVKDLATADPYLEMCGHPAGVRREDLKQSSHPFKFGIRSDRLKDPNVTDLERFRFVPYRKGLFYRHLSKKYPIFAESMANKRITRKIHKTEYACAVMNREAAVMVHAVGRQCQVEGLVYLPVHDGFLTLPRQYGRVCEIVCAAFQAAAGSRPRVRRKWVDR
jgi:hypothetical protein